MTSSRRSPARGPRPPQWSWQTLALAVVGALGTALVGWLSPASRSGCSPAPVTYSQNERR